jgi:hypothetical protein
VGGDVGGADPEVDRGAGWGVGVGVGEQGRDQLAQAVAVAEDLDHLQVAGAGRVGGGAQRAEVDRVGGVVRSSGADGVGTDREQVHRLAFVGGFA